jgi:hypothetical protein
VLAPPSRCVYIIFGHSYFALAIARVQNKSVGCQGGTAHTKSGFTASAEIFTHHGEESSHQPGNCHNGVVYERERYDFAFVGSLEPFWPRCNGPIMTFASAAVFLC